MNFLCLISSYIIYFIANIEVVSSNPLPLWEDNPCRLPLAPGPCDGHFRRFAFNQTTNKCQEFIFGGCQGNKNNFENAEECRQVCQAEGGFQTLERNKSFAKETCVLPKVAGPCTFEYHRFHFNPVSQACEEFIYGGCMANENNFINVNDCMQYCGAIKAKLLEPDLVGGGKLGDDDGLCRQPMEIGRCFETKPRFAYDNQTNSCREFIYTGCAGNGNNFVHGDICAKTCGAHSISYLNGRTNNLTPRYGDVHQASPSWQQPINPVCLLPRVLGPCPSNIPTYSFNPMTRNCERLIYAGCNSNANSFYSSMQCLQTCPAIDVVDMV